MQKILHLFTLRDGLRAEVDGTSHDDGDGIREAYIERIGTENEYCHPNDIPVGLTRSWAKSSGMRPPFYPTVLHAIGDGWKLLAPPIEFKEKIHQSDDDNPLDNKEKIVEITRYQWWLVRD